MTIPQKTIFLPLLLIAGLGVLSQRGTAWCAPLDTPAAVAPSESKPVLKALQISEIEADAALQAKISFTAKAQPLSELLLELQKQSKVVLAFSPDSPATKVKVTAYVQELPLAQVLLGLSRLYGVRWTKIGDVGNAFTMLPNDKSSFERGLMQLGNLEEYTGRFLASQKKSPDHMDWPQEVIKHVNEEDLLKGSTPPVSVLPPELLSKIRKEKEQMAALRLLGMYHAAMEASIDEYILRAEVPKPVTLPDGKTVAQLPRIIVRTQGGKGIASLTPPPAPTLPNNKNQPTRNIPGPT